MSKKVDAIVRTRSLRGGHFRAGRKHEAEPGDIPPGSITEEQLAQLQADPDLEVEIIEPPQGPPQDPTPRKKKPAAPAGPEAGAAGAPEPNLAEAAGDGEDGDADFGFDDDPAPEAEAKGK